jgi:hypothetical protein
MANGTNYYDRPYQIVNSEINDMAARADAAIEVANSVISALSGLQVSLQSTPPRFPLGQIRQPSQAQIAPPSPARFGDISSLNLPPFEDLPLDLNDIDIDVGEFSEPYRLQRPAAPGPIDTSGEPLRPDVNGITVPAFDVDTTVPPLQALDDITIPSFTFPTMPTFTAVAPEYEVVPPSASLDWSEQPYSREILSEVKARVSEMLAGGTGLPPDVEAALFARSRAREDMLAVKQEQEVADQFAAKGFDAPPGMMVRAIDAVREDNRLKASAVNRDLTIKATDVEIENLRFAVTNGIALEQLLINVWNNSAQRAFEAARFRVEADLRLHDSLVAAFNARMQAYQTEVQVFDTRTRAALSVLEGRRIELEGLRVRGELNQQKVAIFNALVEAMRNRIQAYSARVEASKAEADVVRAQIEAYRVDVEAYTQKLSARKLAFDAYEASTRAESALAQGNEAAARAFAATVSAQEAKANVRIRVLQARIEAVQASVQKFAALVQAESGRIAAQRDAIQATAAAYGAEMGRFTAEINRDTADRQLAVSVQEANLRNNLAYYEIEVKEYDAQLARIIEVARVQQAALDSAGRSAAQLAAGAMAAINVGASLSGSASVSDNFSTSFSQSKTWNYDGEDPNPSF